MTVDPTLPLFFKAPHPLERERHGRLRLRTGADTLGFARASHVLPATLAEMAAAGRHYPLVFGPGVAPSLMAVVGLREGRNPFVDRAGGWRAPFYVPAHVRRHPFVLMEAGGGQLVLCLDEAADTLSTEHGRPLYEAGRPSAVVRDMIELCRNYHVAHLATTAFTAALAGRDLLVERRAEVTLNSGERLTVDGFRVVDAARFEALPDPVVLDWRRRGWLAPVYYHLLSLENWGALVDLDPGDEP